MRPVIAALALCLLFVDFSDAYGCGRCGLFGARCRFQKQVFVKPVVAKAIVQYPQQPSQVINLANIYPQGSTVYGQQSYQGVSAISHLYGMNPSLAIESANRIADRGISSLAAAIELGSQNNAGLVEVAKLQAASEHLRTAMMTGEQRQNLQSSVSLRITQGANGIKVEQISGDGGPAGGSDANYPDPPDDSSPTSSLPPPGNPGDLPAAFQTCLRCHSGATPKGEFSLDSDGFTAETITDSIRAISSGAMPPASAEVTLTPQDKGDIMAYLLSRERR